MRNRIWLVILGIGASSLVAVPGATAATTNLGQTGATGTCGGAVGDSFIQASTQAAPVYAVPGSGAITSWSVLASADTTSVAKLRVFRPTGPSFQVVGEGGPQNLTKPSAVNGPFAAAIPVQPGDVLGLHIVAGSTPACLFDSVGMNSDVVKEVSPDNAPVGGTVGGGNLADERVDIAATFTPQPSVGSVGPSSGPRTGGTSVTIHGSDLTGATAVKFGSVPATGVVVDSDSEIRAMAPAQAEGAVDVHVTTPGGDSPVAAGDRFTYERTCVVPKLRGKSLKRAKKTLSKNECRIGKVNGDRSGKVKSQKPKAGVVLAGDGKVNFKLG